MSKYTVGINVEEIIEAKDADEAISKLMDNISWKDCYCSEYSEPKTERENEE